jgi:signal peptidase I
MNQKKKRKYLKYILINIFIAAVIVTILMKFVFSAIKINGKSMSPTLEDGDRVIISKINIRNSIRRFDIVVMHNPRQKKKPLVKRVIALPGESIELKNGRVYINRKLLQQHFIKSPGALLTDPLKGEPLILKSGQFFVMGDNRNFSKDSRVFGAVPVQLIYGKATFRYWPLSKFGSIK